MYYITWTHCNQSDSVISMTNAPEMTFKAVRSIFIASPYSMTLMSVSITSYYCSSPCFSARMHPAVHRYGGLKSSAGQLCLAVIMRALCWLLSPRQTVALSSPECRIAYKVRSQKSPASELFSQPPVVQFGKIARGETRMPVISLSGCYVVLSSLTGMFKGWNSQPMTLIASLLWCLSLKSCMYFQTELL